MSEAELAAATAQLTLATLPRDAADAVLQALGSARRRYDPADLNSVFALFSTCRAWAAHGDGAWWVLEELWAAYFPAPLRARYQNWHVSTRKNEILSGIRALRKNEILTGIMSARAALALTCKRLTPAIRTHELTKVGLCDVIPGFGFGAQERTIALYGHEEEFFAMLVAHRMDRVQPDGHPQTDQSLPPIKC